MEPGKKMMIAMALLFSVITVHSAVQNQGAEDKPTLLQLNCSAELTELARELAEQYQLETPAVAISIATLQEKGTAVFPAEGEIALSHKGCLREDAGQGLEVVVGRDVIVPVMNIDNPQKELIIRKGISPEQFASVYKSGGKLSWGELLGSMDRSIIEAYIPGKECAKAYLSGFLGMTSGELSAVEVNTSMEMISIIEAEPNAIGFCTLACLSEMEHKGINPGIILIPVDMDGSGAIERFEDIYGSYAELSHGIFLGKYPRELFGKIYAVANQQPAGEAETAFLEWMITEGQVSLASVGILRIDYSEKASGLQELYPASRSIAEVPVKASSTRAVLTVLAALMALGILIMGFGRRFGKHEGDRASRSVKPGLFGADLTEFPAGLFYDRSHTWAFMEKTGRVRLGIDDFIPRVTGPVTRVVLKPAGEKIRRGESLVTIVQHGKQMEIYSPVSGRVIEQNDDLLRDAALINRDPYSAGWIYMVEPANWKADMESLYMGEPYGTWLKTELVRLKDFFSNGLKINMVPDLVPVLQDGGEIRDGVLEECGPEVWEEFQTVFINNK